MSDQPLPPTETSVSGQHAWLPDVELVTPPPPAHSCRIFIRPGLARDIGPLVRERFGQPRAVVVSDENVFPLCGEQVVGSLRTGGLDPVVCVLPPGEGNKHLATLMPAYQTVLSAGIDRSTPVVAVGGGVVGDMAGLLAATLLRGLPWVQVPTTLLAMVDASVGGKTGVNLDAGPGGKNLIGAFHPPDLVLCDPDTLATLPEAELSQGLAECIKHDLIADAGHLRRLTDLMPAVLGRDRDVLTELVRHNVLIKAEIVRQDPTERGVRAFLNLGHTFAHAFEAVSRHALPHGQAVGLGLLAASFVSRAMGLLPADQLELIESAVRAARLPVRLPPVLADRLGDAPAVLDAMSRDKKVQRNRVRFVLLAPAGNPVVRDDVPVELVGEALRWLRGSA